MLRLQRAGFEQTCRLEVTDWSASEHTRPHDSSTPLYDAPGRSWTRMYTGLLRTGPCPRAIRSGPAICAVRAGHHPLSVHRPTTSSGPWRLGYTTLGLEPAHCWSGCSANRPPRSSKDDRIAGPGPSQRRWSSVRIASRRLYITPDRPVDEWLASTTPSSAQRRPAPNASYQIASRRSSANACHPIGLCWRTWMQRRWLTTLPPFSR